MWLVYPRPGIANPVQGYEMLVSRNPSPNL